MDPCSLSATSSLEAGTINQNDEDNVDVQRFTDFIPTVPEERSLVVGTVEYVIILTKEAAYYVEEDQLLDYECPAKLKEAMTKKCRFKSILLRDNEAFIASRRSVYVLNMTTGRLMQCPYTSPIEGNVRPRIATRERRVFCSVGNRVYCVEKTRVFRVGVTKLPIVRFAPLREDGSTFEFCYNTQNNTVYHTVCTGGNHSTEVVIGTAIGQIIGAYEASVFIWTTDKKEAIVFQDDWVPRQKYLFRKTAIDFINSGPIIYVLFKDGLHVVNTSNRHVFTIPNVPKGRLVLCQQGQPAE